MSSSNLIKSSEYPWIHVDYDLKKIGIFSTNVAYVGYYTVVLVQSFKDYPDVFPFSHFKVTIQPPLISSVVKK